MMGSADIALLVQQSAQALGLLVPAWLQLD